MIKPGRSTTAAARANVVEGGFGRRPDAPIELTVRQAEIWRDVVASEPVDYFATAALRAILSDYCRHYETAEKLSHLINVFKPDWIRTEEGSGRFNDLCKMRDRETRAAVMLATKLRMTNQARYTTLSAATASRNTIKGPKPWEAS